MSETEPSETPEPVDAPEVVEESATPEPTADASGSVSAETEADAGCETVDADDVEVVTVDPAAAREAELQKQLDELQARLRAVSSAYREQQDEIAETKARLERQAALKEEMRRGLQEAPQALEDIYAGANMGKMLIQV